MSTLKEQLERAEAEHNKSVVPKIIEQEKAPQFGNPYRAEYIKSAEAIQEKLIKRGKTARPSKKSKVR
jgi:hypothetical protein